MAEILIKGMEMPKSCDDCTMKCALFELYYGMDELEGERHPNCPFIELPPHGDLISRSLALSACYEMARFKEMDGAFEVIENIPTVIPASK